MGVISPHPPGHVLTGDATGDSGNKIFTVRENGVKESLLLTVTGETAVKQSIF